MNKIIYILLIGYTLASNAINLYGTREVAIHITTMRACNITRITGIDCTEIINGHPTSQHYITPIKIYTFAKVASDLLDFLGNAPLVTFDRETYEHINKELSYIGKPNLQNKIRTIIDFGELFNFSGNSLEDWSMKYGIEYSQYLKGNRLSELIVKIYQKAQEDLKDRMKQISARLAWEDDIEKNIADLHTFAREHRELAMKMDNITEAINSLGQRMDEESAKIETLVSEQCKIKGDINDLQQKRTSSRKKARKAKTILEEEKEKDASNKAIKPRKRRNKKTVRKPAKPKSQDNENEDSVTEEIIQDQKT